MQIDKIEMDFIKSLESDCKMLAHGIASSIAHTISDEMAIEYQYIIDRFYHEYNPDYYKRHSERGMQPGLNKTFKKYYKNPHNTIYYGGIEISSDNMYDDYHDSKDAVLSSFLNGYHGRPSLGIESSLLPYKHMLRYKESLINDLGSDNSTLLFYAKNKAKKLPYQLIKIK